mgnify:CR=1 FL=1
MGYVFIRYSKHDREFVTGLSDDLEAAGVDVWRGNEEIAPGQNWGEAIQRAIVGADAVLYVSSQSTMNSTLLASDLETALENEVPVLPIVLDFMGFKHMPKLLYGITWLDFRKGYEQTFEDLIKRIPESAQSDSPIEPKGVQTKGYVFISYAEEDTDFVVHLREFLREKGYGYWDYQDSNRDYHTQLFLELEDVIREASATLSVLSPSWKASPWTPKEFLFSQDVDTPVFLLRAKEMEPTLLTAGVPYIDFVDNKIGGFEKLELELKRKGLL